MTFMNDFTDGLLHISPPHGARGALMSWSVKVEIFVCFLFGGGYVEGLLWEVSASLIVKVL